MYPYFISVHLNNLGELNRNKFTSHNLKKEQLHSLKATPMYSYKDLILSFTIRHFLYRLYIESCTRSFCTTPSLWTTLPSTQYTSPPPFTALKTWTNIYFSRIGFFTPNIRLSIQIWGRSLLRNIYSADRFPRTYVQLGSCHTVATFHSWRQRQWTWRNVYTT